MGDQDKEKSMENPDVVHKLGMTQMARVVKSHECPKVVSCQRVSGTKGCQGPKGTSYQRLRTSKGTRTKRHDWPKGACSKRCLSGQVRTNPYGSAYGLSSKKRFQELRMVLVKPRSREGSVSERLCNVWIDDARDELVIVYETVKKLCIESHVSK
ncbi:hypothetical protein YC2023_033763 [Brassica napus]